jgi:hypothetical protein
MLLWGLLTLHVVFLSLLLEPAFVRVTVRPFISPLFIPPPFSPEDHQCDNALLFFSSLLFLKVGVAAWFSIYVFLLRISPLLAMSCCVDNSGPSLYIFLWVLLAC